MPVFHSMPTIARSACTNYWGYAPVSFFAPHPAYSSRPGPLGPVDEFRDMVKALHRAGIEVILDVVFNHTAEGNEHGPTFSFRGIDNTHYYILDADAAATRTTPAAATRSTPTTRSSRRLIVDSLRYWVQEMHVDGFRFDLASILSRDPTGQPLPNPPVLVGHRIRPGARRDQAHRRGLGRRRPVPGRQLRGRQLEGVERPFPRRRPRFPARRRRARSGALPTACWAARASTGTSSASPNRASTSSPATTASPSTISCPTTRSTTRPTAKQNRDGANDNRSWNCGVEGPTTSQGD